MPIFIEPLCSSKHKQSKKRYTFYWIFENVTTEKGLFPQWPVFNFRSMWPTLKVSKSATITFSFLLMIPMLINSIRCKLVFLEKKSFATFAKRIKDNETFIWIHCLPKHLLNKGRERRIFWRGYEFLMNS